MGLRSKWSEKLVSKGDRHFVFSRPKAVVDSNENNDKPLKIKQEGRLRLIEETSRVHSRARRAG